MLQYITKGNVHIKEQARVFYTAHPRDFARYFEEIRTDVYRTQDCAFFYLEPDRQPDEHYYADLAEMQLFIIPVTGYFLYERSRAYEDFLFAQAHHIPVLLLKQEKGYDDLFAEKCGDLQYLFKQDDDHDGIPYAEKLSRFLSSVLVGEETVARIRAAFDAYIFLSYRKKDRTYAKKLMRLIHENDFCRDIAIWYDEYLTAGENFNEAIRAALEKSELFALAVTPNLVNEENYVMSTEYPLAKAEGKPILAVELEETDREALARCYKDLPSCTPCEDRAALSEALLDNLHQIAVRTNDTDPTHNFLIGLAYLSGIDVETNHPRALELIESAAQAGLTEAMEKLAFMYKMGEGVERDLGKAIAWQRRLSDTLFARFEAARLPRPPYDVPGPYLSPACKEISDAALQAAEDLADLYLNQLVYDASSQVLDRVRTIITYLWDMTKDPAYMASLMYNYRRFGDCFSAQRELRAANGCYYTAVAYGDLEFDLFIAPRYYHDHEGVLRQEVLASTHFAQFFLLHFPTDKLDKALSYAQHAITEAEKLDRASSLQNRRLMRKSLTMLSAILLRRGQPGDQEEAQRLCQQCLEECLAEEKDRERLSFLREMSDLYWHMSCGGAAGKNQGVKYYEKLMPVMEEIYERTGNLIDKERLILCYGNGWMFYTGSTGESWEKVRHILTRTIQLAQEAVSISNSAKIYEILMSAYWNRGITGYHTVTEEARIADFQNALQIAQMLSQRFPEDESYRKNIHSLQWWLKKLTQS